MVLESLISPGKATKEPWKLIVLGMIYTSIGIILASWIFKTQSSMIMVFLSTMAAVPLMFNVIRNEEEKDIEGMEEKWLLKEHWKALRAFMWLFVGMTIAYSFWYLFVNESTLSVLFSAQGDVIQSINSRVTGFGSVQLVAFTKIFLNNVRVLIFCILFSFVYGSGAIFLLSWNASVIGAAIGNFMRTGVVDLAGKAGLVKVTAYFSVISLGLMKYVIHGVPEILAYFVAGLAGGIISIAVIRHDFGTKKFEHIVLDSADLLLLSLLILFVAAILEVWVTPMIFS